MNTKTDIFPLFPSINLCEKYISIVMFKGVTVLYVPISAKISLFVIQVRGGLMGIAQFYPRGEQ